jgi:hypothetical protein
MADARLFIVGRRLTLLATLMLLPGGLIVLMALVVALVIMRGERGRSLMRAAASHLPARWQVSIERMLGGSEKSFPRQLPPIRQS